MSLGVNLKRMRKAKGWTQQELAERATIKLTHISTLEKDQGDPKLSTIVKLMTALECSANELLTSPTTGLSSIFRSRIDRIMRLPVRDIHTLLMVIDKFLVSDEVMSIQSNRFTPEEQEIEAFINQIESEELETALDDAYAYEEYEASINDEHQK